MSQFFHKKSWSRLGKVYMKLSAIVINGAAQVSSETVRGKEPPRSAHPSPQTTETSQHGGDFSVQWGLITLLAQTILFH